MARALINVPAKARRGEIVEIKALIQHEMETGFRVSTTGIPLCLENPKIGRAYDAEVVSDRIAEDRPVFRYLLAQEM